MSAVSLTDSLFTFDTASIDLWLSMEKVRELCLALLNKPKNVSTLKSMANTNATKMP